MFKRTKIATSVLVALGGTITLAAMPVFAQTSERIEVTGSRIKSLTVDTVSPVTVIDAKEIRQDGVRNVESFLNNLPQVFAAQASTVVNGSTGTAQVNLRGLGATRTLVLVNGRRMPMGSANTVAPDINQIPAPLLKRVELLTGGASAVYGSDAISGVVNFILNDKFEGVQVELNHSFFNHKQQNSGGSGDTTGRGIADIVAARAITNAKEFKVPGDKSSDGKSTNFSVLIGSNFDANKGNATVFFNYKKDDALLQSERDYSSCSLASSAAGFSCGGSGTSATGRITNTNKPLLKPDGTPNPGGKTNGGKVYTTTNADGLARIFNNGLDQYNFGPLNFYQRPSERYGFNAFANYQVHPLAKVYTELSFHDDLTVAQIAPGGIFGNVATIRGDNPLLSQSWRTALDLVNPTDTTEVVVQRRNVEGGGRASEFRNTSFRYVLGVKGDVGPWSYDAYAIEAKVIYSQNEANYFLDPRIDDALNVVNDNGVAKCASGNSGCVPYNVWKLGGVTADQLAYVQTPGFRKGGTTLKVIGGSVAVDLGEYGAKIPFSTNGIGLSFGVERRAESLSLVTDANTSDGVLSGSGGPTKGLSGRNSVIDIFGELKIPIVEKQPFAELLQATLSARSSKYKSGVDAKTYGAGLEYSPLQEVRFRGGFQRAVRAPNLVELYTAQGNALYDNDADPCAGAVVNGKANGGDGATFAQCANTGVTAAQFGNIQDSPAGQYNFLQGGNPNLKAETADSVTAGFVLTPLRDLSISFDYFDIKVKDTISNIDPTTTLAKCIAKGNPTYCNLITRDRLGTLWLLDQAKIIGTNVNLGSLRTSGMDFGLTYNQKLGEMGSAGVSFVGTLLTKYTVEEIKGDGTYDCVGLYGPNKCGSPNPKWRHKLRASWNTPFDVEMAVTWRHLDKLLLQATSDNPKLNGTEDGGTRVVVNPVDRELAARDYFDFAVTWNAFKGFSLTGGINNLLDKDPPLSAQTGTGQGNGNTFPSVYDALGRKVFVTASYKF
jgi:iron complex outermembrane recepter protein